MSDLGHEQFVPTVQAWAQQRPAISRVFLYGSYVKRSKPTPDDLDVAVEFTEAAWAGDDLYTYWFHSKTELKESLADKIDVPLDLQLYDPLLAPNVASYVADHGVLVYERKT